MAVSRQFKDLVRRLAVTMFGFLELLGLPRIPDEKGGEGGEKR
jgi:hypothetical protein